MNHQPLTYAAEQSKISGDLQTTKLLYEQLIASLTEELNLSLLYNRHYAPPWEISTTVLSLSNYLLMQADVIESLDGNYDISNKMRNDVVSLTKQFLTKSQLAEVERSRASSLITQGRFNEALTVFSTSLDLFESESNFEGYAKTTLDLVNILQWLGDFDRAINEITKAESILAKINVEHQDNTDYFDLDSVMKKFGSTFVNESNFQEQLAKINSAVLLQQLKILIDFYGGIINKYLGNYVEAQLRLNRTLPLLPDLKAAIEFHLVDIMFKQGQYHEALSASHDLESQIVFDQRLRPKLAGLLRLQAEALLQLGRKQDSLDTITHAIKDLQQYYDADLLWRSQWFLGKVLASMEDKSKSLDAYMSAIKTINALRRVPLGYRLDSTYLKDKIELFSNAIFLSCELQDAAKCCHLIESIKSRILTTLLNTKKVVSEDGNNLKTRLENVSRVLDSIEYLIYKDGLTADLQQRKSELVKERILLLERIRLSDPRWRLVTESVEFNLQETIDFLIKQNQSALNIFFDRAKMQVVSVLIRNDGNLLCDKINITQETESKLDMYERNLNLAKPHPEIFDVSVALSLNLLDLIPSNIIKVAINSCSGLIVVPHGPLHLLPWASLMFDNKRLFEYCPVSILPNLGFIDFLKSSSFDKSEIALVGPPNYENMVQLEPLEGAETEIEQIKQIYEFNGRKIITPILVGPSATEENFWKLVSANTNNGAILHIACHGTFDIDEPMNSALLLSSSKIDAAEISTKPIQFDEIILSACNTGWRPSNVNGISLLGDDILGLPGAFMESGAKSILVSIPPASDEAIVQFMNLYHQFRAKGMYPLDAFQKSQKEMMLNQNFQPFSWIGLTLYGVH